LRVCAPDVNLSLESTQVLPLSKIVQIIGAERAQEACGIGMEGKEGLVDIHPEWGIVLGLDMIRGLDQGSIKRILRGREEGPYQDLEDLASRARLRSTDLERLSQAGAVNSMGYQRREGIWASGVLGQDGGEEKEYQPMLEGLGMEYHLPSLPPLDSVAQMNLDYEAMGLSVTSHPFALIRKQMNAQGVIPACEILRQENQSRIRVAGIITHRQRPCSGGGVLFLSLEDESGSVNVTVTEATWKQHRREVMASAVVVDGYCENAYGTRSVRAFRIYPFSTQLRLSSRDFR
jgi:error-prone DNA polymerase